MLPWAIEFELLTVTVRGSVASGRRYTQVSGENGLLLVVVLVVVVRWHIGTIACHGSVKLHMYNVGCLTSLSFARVGCVVATSTKSTNHISCWARLSISVR